jgi:L-alanine-DL-glutamate epimerase-like enolase superfamily enzyme
MTEFTVRRESWPLAEVFTIARGSKTSAEVVVCQVRREGAMGRGESVPYARYGESVERVVEELEALKGALEAGLDRQRLQEVLPPGAARNALDCALWDLEAGLTGSPVHELAGLSAPKPVTTAYTLSLSTPEKMGEAARRNAHRPLLKIKLAGSGDLERVAAVRENAPGATLIADANEGWLPALVEPFSEALARLGVAMVEQPLPAGEDQVLAELEHPVPLCADESCHTAADLEEIAPCYELVNVKLDKTGGLTQALVLLERALSLGLGIMVGCMVGTSLAMAPAVLLAAQAQYVDLDGPLLLRQDRQHGLHYEGSRLHPPAARLWGWGQVSDETFQALRDPGG